MKRPALFALILVLTTCLLTGCRRSGNENTTVPTTTRAPMPSTTATTTAPATVPTTMPTVPATTDNATNGTTDGVIEDIIDDVTGNGTAPSGTAGRNRSRSMG